MRERLKPFKSQLEGLSEAEIAEFYEKGQAMHTRGEVVPENSSEAYALARAIRVSRETYYGKTKEDADSQNSDSDISSILAEAV